MTRRRGSAGEVVAIVGLVLLIIWVIKPLEIAVFDLSGLPAHHDRQLIPRRWATSST